MIESEDGHFLSIEKEIEDEIIGCFQKLYSKDNGQITREAQKTKDQEATEKPAPNRINQEQTLKNSEG